MGKDYSRITDLLQCLVCKGSLLHSVDAFQCSNCGGKYPIVEGVPRFVDPSFYDLSETSDDVVEKTKNYFGYEWDHFRDWGFIEDDRVPPNEAHRYAGGRVSDRIGTFDSKCRLEDVDLKDRVVLDAGCGNGRYTYEAGGRASDTSIVLGVDIGYGSVRSAARNTQEQENVFILHASLFELPLRDGVVQSCFSNGVLMHTGDARKAFGEVARVIEQRGIFVAHLYGKLNPVWEFNDRAIRAVTTRLSIEQNMRLAKAFSLVSRAINRFPKGFRIANYLLRLQPSIIHMYDWYSAPVASHHTYRELAQWYQEERFEILDDYQSTMKAQEKAWLDKPWAINLKGAKDAD